MRELFRNPDVTRDIAPVVYFHDQDPAKVADEVSEYIITGGFPKGHPGHKRVPEGIHEQYIRLLRNISDELDGNADLPASWISGFYGSGKSSFAKLLGLALDGMELPDGRSVAKALLDRNTTPRKAELTEAWQGLAAKIDPISVIFDIGGTARNDEHLHTAVVRKVQERLGYCPQGVVADFELKLERDGKWKDFEEAAQTALGKPWAEAKNRELAEDDFSLAMHTLDPVRYVEPGSWFTERIGLESRATSVEESTRAMKDMLDLRAPGKTLFVVVDEVSQYIHQDEQRMLRLQSFVSELGRRLGGRAWLLVTGQQKLDEQNERQVLGKLKDRFKPRLRVHLAATNIRDVVHKRLLEKSKAGDETLRGLFQRHRNNLKLYAYGCEDITEDDFVEVYPLLPNHVDLLLRITSAMRNRSTRSQGDDQAIRGLLQLLGELFRSHGLADATVGSLVTLDQIYEVQQTALDADTQRTMARILDYCAKEQREFTARAAKAVALMELVNEEEPTTAALIARCLYDRIDANNPLDEVKAALEDLSARKLLGYSEKLGYKIQSSAGEEWERERADFSVSGADKAQYVQETLRHFLAMKRGPEIGERRFPWRPLYGDDQGNKNVAIVASRDLAHVAVDFRLIAKTQESHRELIIRSDEDSELKTRIIWVSHARPEIEAAARDYGRSLRMIQKYKDRRASLTQAKVSLLLQEESRLDDLRRRLESAVDTAWTGGSVYFRGGIKPASEFGTSLPSILGGIGDKYAPMIYDKHVPLSVSDSELSQLLATTLDAPSPKFLEKELGILTLDGGRYVATCDHVIPGRIYEAIKTHHGLAGASLVSEFESAPYGYVPNVVRACIAGLLRAEKIKLEAEDGSILTAVRDAGVREIFQKDRAFKRAQYFPATDGEVTAKDRARICKLLKTYSSKEVDREPSAIADAVAQQFPRFAEKTRTVIGHLKAIGPEGDNEIPPAIDALETALTNCMKDVRRTEPTVLAVKRNFDKLNDGLQQLFTLDAELDEEVIEKIALARNMERYQLAQLAAVGSVEGDVEHAAKAIREQLGAKSPWLDIDAVTPQVEIVKEAYRKERKRLFAEEEGRLEEARIRVKRRDGFATLTADQADHILRPLRDAASATDADALVPALLALANDAPHNVQKAENEANERFDKILSEVEEEPIHRVDLKLSNREIRTEAELDAVLAEIRDRIMAEIAAGRRVRLQ